MPHKLGNVIIFGLIAMTLLSIYLPAINTYYLYHDDVNFFLQTATQKFPKSYHFSLAIGRFIGAPIYAANSWLIETVADLKFIRLISIFQFTICAYLLTLLLKDIFKSIWQAACIATLTVTLPAFQVLATQAGYAFQTTGVLLGLLSVTCANKIPVDKGIVKRSCNVYSVLSVFLLILAIATHPSTAMFYWVGVGAILIALSHTSMNNLLIKSLNLYICGFIGMGLYAIIIHVTKGLHKSTNYGIYNPYMITTDYTAKFKWFIQEPLFNSLNLWNIYPKTSLAMFVSAFLFVSFITFICRAGSKMKQEQKNRTLQKSLFLLAVLTSLLALSFSTNLLAVGHASFYRCCIALSSLLFIYVAVCLQFWIKLVAKPAYHQLTTGIFVIGLVIIGIFTHRQIIFNRIQPSHIEFTYLLEQFEDINLAKFQRIHLIRPNRKRLRNRYDEFGGPTASFKGDTIGLISAAIQETLKDSYDLYHIHFDFKNNLATYIFTDENLEKKGFKIKITSGTKQEAIYGTIPTLIVDMETLYNSSGALAYLRNDL